MITSMHIENFKCFKDFDIELGPFNVLIGPNDTGKTALLQALKLGGLLGGGMGVGRNREQIEQEVGFGIGTECAWRNDPSAHIRVTMQASRSREPSPKQTSLFLVFHAGSLPPPFVAVNILDRKTRLGSQEAMDWYAKSIGNVCYYRLDPKALRRPCPLGKQMNDVGEGFPAFLDSINRESRKVFFELESRFYERFPYYRQLTLPDKELASGGRGLSVSFQTIKGETLGCESVSDGVILSLAFMAIAHQPRPPEVLLIEEPETGVHHSSLKDTIETLKHLTQEKGVQVILTTHSPYLLDHVEADQVYVFTKDRDEGSVTAKRLSDFEGADEISDMFSTGEKWSLLAEKYGI